MTGSSTTHEKEEPPVATSPAVNTGTRREFWRKFRDAAVIVFAAIAAALLLRTFVFEALHIPSRSMQPSLLAGDFVIINKLTFGPPARGEVFAFHSPAGIQKGGREDLYVKRCVAIPGDSLFVARGIVWVNGTRVSVAGEVTPEDVGPPKSTGLRQIMIIPRPGDEIPLSDSTLSFWHPLIEREGHRVTTGPAGEILLDGIPATTYRVTLRHYFFAGDNTTDSFDSRNWGLLPESAILGKAILIYWSWDSARSAVRWERVGMIVR